MKRIAARGWLGLLVAVLIAVYGYHEVCTIKDKQGVATMTAQMKTVCVGRFLIDLPAKADGTRWFSSGALLPPATFMVRPLDGRRNNPTVICRRTWWALVRVDGKADDSPPGVA
jgi:hypothetical protein